MSYLIKPSDININNHFWDSFNHCETEDSARLLVRMAQEHESWRNFTQEEIDKSSKCNFHFNRLLNERTEKPPIKKNEDGTYSFTHQFISTCFHSSPTIKFP